MPYIQNQAVDAEPNQPKDNSPKPKDEQSSKQAMSSGVNEGTKELMNTLRDLASADIDGEEIQTSSDGLSRLFILPVSSFSSTGPNNRQIKRRQKF